MDCSRPGSSVRGMFQARTLEWVAFCPPGDLPEWGIKHRSLASPALAGRFFTTGLPGKPSQLSVFPSSKSAVCKMRLFCCCYVVFICLLSPHLFLSSNNNPFPGYPIFNGISFQQCGYLNKLYCLRLLFVCMFNQLLPTGESEWQAHGIWCKQKWIWISAPPLTNNSVWV